MLIYVPDGVVTQITPRPHEPASGPIRPFGVPEHPSRLTAAVRAAWAAWRA